MVGETKGEEGVKLCMPLCGLYKPDPKCSRKVNVLVYFCKHRSRVCVVKITSQDEESVWVYSLLLTDGMIQFTECFVPIVVVSAGWNVNSDKQDHCEFPRNVKGSALIDYKLH